MCGLARAVLTFLVNRATVNKTHWPLFTYSCKHQRKAIPFLHCSQTPGITLQLATQQLVYDCPRLLDVTTAKSHQGYRFRTGRPNCTHGPTQNQAIFNVDTTSLDWTQATHRERTAMSMYTQHAPVLDLQAAWVQDSSPCSLLWDSHATGRLASEKGPGMSATTEVLCRDRDRGCRAETTPEKPKRGGRRQ